MFGKFVKQIRIAKQIGLREFCVATGIDPSNWSKIERGIISPPQDRQVLDRVASILAIGDDQDRMELLFAYAAIDAGKIPEPVMRDAELLKRLPLFFRTAGGKKPTPEELERLAEIIRHS